MIREIVKDEEVLSKKCTSVTKQDKELVNTIVQDLIDTANEYPEYCIGLAANQIGYDKKVVIIKIDGKWKPFINPEFFPLTRTKFMSEEGCMSFEGTRKIERYFTIMVMYLDQKLKPQKVKLTDLPAVIAQHEIGHTYGQLV